MDDGNCVGDESPTYDAVLGDSFADPVGPAVAGSESDPVSLELRALFAVALADEPASVVSAESVLREVHASGRKRFASGNRSARGGFARWLAAGPASLKWGGGLVAAAALVAAAVVIGPNILSHSAQDSAATAGASVQSQMASEAAADASGDESESSAASAASATSAAAGSEGDSALPAAAAAEAAPLGDSAPSGAASAGSAAGSAAAPQSSAAVNCPLSPLHSKELSAAIAAVPTGLTRKPWTIALCSARSLRGSGIIVGSSDGQPEDYVRIIVSQGSIGRDGAGSDSLVVSAAHGALTVTVIANDRPQLGEATLQQIARAVADVLS
ncbi:MAG: hypothetical protein ABI382_02760 [Nakamurella sp.]